jgi:hypothetical protein
MRNYYRQFVTLLQERPGYAVSGKQAVGRIVIEAREDMARAMVYIQDLSPQNTYKLAFVSKAGEANLGVVLGSVIVNGRGRYEGKFEFDRTNIGGAGITCEGIDACVIFLDGDEEEFIAPLAGYRAQPFSWRVNLSFPDGKEESPILEVKHIEEAVEAPVQEIAEVAEDAHEEVPPPVYAFVTEDSIEIEPAVEDNVVSVLFEGGEAVEVFADSTRFPDARWVVTTLQGAGAVDDRIFQNPLVAERCQEHKHILLGRNIDADGRDTYILGVPDVFDVTVHTNEHEFNSIFDSFKLCNPNDPVKGAHGYWLKTL